MKRNDFDFSEDAIDPASRRKPSSLIIRWRAFLLTRQAQFLRLVVTVVLLVALANVGLETVPAWMALPLSLLLSGVLFLTFRAMTELRVQVDTLSHEVIDVSEQYQTLTNNLAAAIIIRDNTGQLLFCSPFIEVLTGYSRAEIYEQGENLLAQIVHEDDRELYQRAQKVTAYGEAFQYRLRFFHKSGIQMWAESRTVPILDEEGAVTSSLSVLIDVTGAALYQRQVEEMNRDMQDFSYMISHDLKAPIATVKGMLTVLHEENLEALSADAREAVSHIENATRRLELLVGAVLEYSRISNTQTEREPTDLAVIFSDIATDFGPQLRAVKGELHLPEESISILGERLRVYQIFSNLIGNAIKYRDQTRPLKISVSVTHSHSARWVSLVVKDNGIGIPQEKQEAVFRPFYRAHAEQAEGAGVGLASVKKIVEKLGGQISLSSIVGVGSEFVIKFLRDQASSSQAESTTLN